MNQESQSHRATPEQWEHVQISAGMKQQIPWATADCILELRSRIEALEAQQRREDKLDRLITLDAADPTPDAASTEVRPVAGLVERVALVLDSSCPQDEYVIADCRAAIRAVAAWLRSVGNNGSADDLEREIQR
jgi:hypothetical protein